MSSPVDPVSEGVEFNISRKESWHNYGLNYGLLVYGIFNKQISC